MPVDATAPDEPQVFGYLLDWWTELAEARPAGMAGPGPISYGEIAAWAALYGIDVLPVEVKLLRRLDRIFLASRA